LSYEKTLWAATEGRTEGWDLIEKSAEDDIPCMCRAEEAKEKEGNTGREQNPPCLRGITIFGCITLIASERGGGAPEGKKTTKERIANRTDRGGETKKNCQGKRLVSPHA